MFDTTAWAEYRDRIGLGPVKKFFRMACQFMGRFAWLNGFRLVWYRLMGMNVGKEVFIGLDCYIDPDFAELITIENEVSVSFRVTIIAHDWSRRLVAPVLVRKGAIIGTGAIVLPGVCIGEAGYLLRATYYNM